jgi:hypothetical protein
MTIEINGMAHVLFHASKKRRITALFRSVVVLIVKLLPPSFVCSPGQADAQYSRPRGRPKESNDATISVRLPAG